ncbi:hypothetical protein FB451DRAFT_1463569 [Mycena latifolia]|nr:hypothetical protein FB451DRAFT_1463569 [Mycena latifolia]
MAKKDRSKSQGKKRSSGPPLVRYHTVIREPDGTFVCDCTKYEETGKTCSDIVAARYYYEFGSPTEYLAAEQGKEEHGPSAKGKRTVPPRKSTGVKGLKTNMPTDQFVDEIHDALLANLEDEHWNPFPASETQPSPDNLIPGSTLSSGRPAAAKPLHNRKSSSQSPVKFSGKPGPPGPGFNSILAALPPDPPAMSPTKISSQNTAATENRPGTHRSRFRNESIPHMLHEDMQIIDIDFKHWVQTYRLRQDEALEVVDILNALCLAAKNGILVYGPSYAQDAKTLRKAVWSASDNDPILADGARNHWLLLKFSLENDIHCDCFEPLKTHLKLADIQDMCLLARFFARNRPSEVPASGLDTKYDTHLLDIQHDGDSCGFWMITVGFLLVSRVKTDDAFNQHDLNDDKQ